MSELFPYVQKDLEDRQDLIGRCQGRQELFPNVQEDLEGSEDHRRVVKKPNR